MISKSNYMRIEKLCFTFEGSLYLPTLPLIHVLNSYYTTLIGTKIDSQPTLQEIYLFQYSLSSKEGQLATLQSQKLQFPTLQNIKPQIAASQLQNKQSQIAASQNIKSHSTYRTKGKYPLRSDYYGNLSHFKLLFENIGQRRAFSRNLFQLGHKKSTNSHVNNADAVDTSDYDTNSTATLISEMRAYATNLAFKRKSKLPPADGKQLVVKNSLFLLKLKEVMNSNEISGMNARQLTEHILNIYAEYFETWNNFNRPNPYVEKSRFQERDKLTSSNSNSKSSNQKPPPTQGIKFSQFPVLSEKKMNATSSEQEMSQRKFFVEDTENLVHGAPDTSAECKQQNFTYLIYPNLKSFQILFSLFTNRKYSDLFDFEYFTSRFLQSIFLHHCHLLDESFIDEVFQNVVSTNQLLNDGLTLFILYTNYINRAHIADQTRQEHLFNCFILLLKESIKMENAFVMKVLLEFADSNFKDSILGTIDESLSLEHQNQLYICLMDLYARSGDVEAAVSLFEDKILSPNLSSSTLSQVMTTLLTPYTAVIKKPYSNEERKGVVNTILDKAPHGTILDIVVADSILEMFIKDREWEKSRNFIERFYNIDEALKEEISTKPYESRLTSDQRLAPTYMSLIKIFLVYSTFGEASQLQKYYNQIARISSRKDHTRLANFVLLAHLRSGNSQKALLTFQELFRSKWQTNTYATCVPDVDTWKITLQACKASGARRMLEAVQQELNLESMRKERVMNLS